MIRNIYENHMVKICLVRNSVIEKIENMGCVLIACKKGVCSVDGVLLNPGGGLCGCAEAGFFDGEGGSCCNSLL